MQPPDPAFLQQVADSLQTFAFDRFWQWIVGLVVAAVLASRAYIRGVRGPILYLLAGAAIGIGSVVGATALFVWSKWAFYALAATVIAFTVASGAVRAYRRERTRLEGHPKGWFDYQKDLKNASTRNLQAMSRLTKETTHIGNRTAKLAEQYTQSTSEFGREFISNRTARMFRSAAIRYRRDAGTFQRNTTAFMDAIAGILIWLDETQNSEQLELHKATLRQFRETVISSRDSTLGYRDSLVGLPNMSQRLNAARSELTQCVEISLATMDSAIAFIDKSLA